MSPFCSPSRVYRSVLLDPQWTLLSDWHSKNRDNDVHRFVLPSYGPASCATTNSITWGERLQSQDSYLQTHPRHHFRVDSYHTWISSTSILNTRRHLRKTVQQTMHTVCSSVPVARCGCDHTRPIFLHDDTSYCTSNPTHAWIRRGERVSMALPLGFTCCAHLLSPPDLLVIHINHKQIEIC